MLATYHNAIRDHGETLITHIGLANVSNIEPVGGSPAYARLPVTWVDDGNGIMRPTTNLTFDVPTGFTVTQWRGFSALTLGVDYGGAPLTSTEFTSQGEYRLNSAATAVSHQAL